MDRYKKTYVLGCGAIGLTLAACLAEQGRDAIAVRTSTSEVVAGKITVTIDDGVEAKLKVSIETTSLTHLTKLDGLIAITAKSYANPAIAAALRKKSVTGPLVLLQNGLGVEQPFIAAQFSQIHRCVLYATAQVTSENTVTFRPITSSPIGLITGPDSGLEECVTTFTTPRFPFHIEPDIQRDIWKKTIINAVFNSICPLLDSDNGIFARDPAVAALAREIVQECILLAKGKGIQLTEPELMEQIIRISHGSAGISISTRQDIKNGRPTEIESLNFEMARLASSMDTPINLSKTEFLGKMILAKSNKINRSVAS